jgi:chromosome segregation ATPase
MPTKWILVLAFAALALFLRGCQQSNEHALLRYQAEDSEAKVAELESQLATITADNDSLRTAIAVSDSAFDVNVAQWQLERRDLASRAVSASSEHDDLHARLTALGDSTVSALADSLAASHRATVASYEAQIETYVQENEALRVSVGQLRSLVGGLELELETQKGINVEQQVQLQIWEELANPPWHEKLKRAIPSVGVGASLAVVGLVAAGAL